VLHYQCSQFIMSSNHGQLATPTTISSTASSITPTLGSRAATTLSPVLVKLTLLIIPNNALIFNLETDVCSVSLREKKLIQSLICTFELYSVE
jgi:hypothetical protein